MAAKIDAGTTKVTRQDVLLIDPREIVVDLALNGRSEPHDAASVADLAASLARDGQLQPVVVRKLPSGKVQLVAGFRRHAAAMLLRENNDEVRLKCSLKQCNDEEAFLANIVENFERKECSPIDHAVNHRRLRDAYGWEVKRIAETFRMSPSYVSQLQRLLTLSSDVRRQVHTGEIGVGAALALSEFAADEVASIIDDAEASGTPIREVARERSRRNGAVKPRSVKELRDGLAALVADEDATLSAIATRFVAYLNGECGTEELRGDLLAALGG